MKSLEGRASLLKERVERCRCRYCGGELELRRIIFSDYEDARVEIFCPQCDRIEYGVEPKVYQCARFFVEEMDFKLYPELDDNAYTRRMTIAKVADILAWGLRQLGYMTDEGFAQAPEPNRQAVGECLLVDDEALRELLNGRELS